MLDEQVTQVVQVSGFWIIIIIILIRSASPKISIIDIIILFIDL